MRSLSIDQLRALAGVVTCGSFTEAARQLNLTQPAVSLQIRELELRWGVRLIERFGKQALATEPGRRLLEHAQRIFAECEAVEESMRRFQEGWIGRIRIGTTLTALLYDLPPVLRELHAKHPGLEVGIANMPTRDVNAVCHCPRPTPAARRCRPPGKVTTRNNWTVPEFSAKGEAADLPPRGG